MSSSSSTTSTRTPASRPGTRVALAGRPPLRPPPLPSAQPEPDGEDRAQAAAVAVRLHGAAVHLDEVADQGQPQAQAAVGARRRAVRLAEPVEHVGQELRRDPDAGVRRPAGRPDRPPRTEAHVDAPGRGRELDRVRHHVPHDLLQARGVAADHDGRRGRARRRAVTLLARPPGPEARPRPCARRAARSTAFHSSCIVPDTSREASRMSSTSWAWTLALRSMVARPWRRRAGSSSVVLQEARPAQDRLQRRAQLVGDGGQELVLDPMQLLGLLVEALVGRRSRGAGPLRGAAAPSRRGW